VIVIIVPLIVVLTLGAISVLATVLDHITSIPSTKDVSKVLSNPDLATLIQGERYATGRVPTLDLAIVEVLTSPPASLVKGWVHHYSGAKHCIEVLDLCVYLLVVLRQQERELINYDSGGQSIVCKRAVNLLTLPLDPAGLFLKRLRPILESVMTCWTLPVERGVCPPKAAPTSGSSSDAHESSCRPQCLFTAILSASQANRVDRSSIASAFRAISSLV
jgi:hypothetical protein